MEHIRDALLRLVKAGVAIKKLQETYLQNGLDDNPLFDAYGNIADAICIITGECKNTFEETTTNIALTVPGLNDEHRVCVLMAEYKRNHPEQPAPHFISRDEMRKSVKQNGGYLYETPEGDWT